MVYKVSAFVLVLLWEFINSPLLVQLSKYGDKAFLAYTCCYLAPRLFDCGVCDVAAFRPPLFSACTAPSSSKQVVFRVLRSVRPKSLFGSPVRCTQSRIKTIMLSSKDDEKDDEEVEGGGS